MFNKKFQFDYYKYYNNIYFYKYYRLEYLLNIIRERKDISLLVNNSIKFRDLIEFGMSDNKVIKLLSKPVAIFTKLKLKNHKILLYSWFIDNINVKAELHFFTNKFIMGVYFFELNLNPVFYTNIIRVNFIEKYMISQKDVVNNTFSIIDRYDNLIFVNENSEYSIFYITGDNDLLNSVRNQIAQDNMENEINIKIKLEKIKSYL